MPNTRHTYFPGSEGTHFAGMPVQHSVRVAARICPVFRFLTGNAPEPARLRVIGRIEPPAFDPEDFPGFTVEAIVLGLTVPATSEAA